MPAPPLKRLTITFRLGTADRVRLAARAKRAGISRSELIRRLVADCTCAAGLPPSERVGYVAPQLEPIAARTPRKPDRRTGKRRRVDKLAAVLRPTGMHDLDAGQGAHSKRVA